MARAFLYQRRIEFCETDAAGIVHFSSLLLYAEQAEHAFLRHLGTSVLQRGLQDESGKAYSISWPRVRIECDFQGMARFENILDIELTIARLGNKSITYGFSMHHDGRLVCRGNATSVCCRIDHEGNIAASEIPGELKTSLASYAVSSVEPL